MAGEHRRQPTWNNIAKVILKKSKEEHSEEIKEMFEQIAINKKKENTMEALRLQMLKIIKKK
jgi:hypothetical protein